jgi:hypothetical protein
MKEISISLRFLQKISIKKIQLHQIIYKPFIGEIFSSLEVTSNSMEKQKFFIENDLSMKRRKS